MHILLSVWEPCHVHHTFSKIITRSTCLPFSQGPKSDFSRVAVTHTPTHTDKKQRGTCGYSQATPALRILAPVEKRSLQMKAFTGHSSPIGCYWFAKMCHICNTWRSPKVRREWKPELDALSVLVLWCLLPLCGFPAGRLLSGHIHVPSPHTGGLHLLESHHQTFNTRISAFVLRLLWPFHPNRL